ncbi:MAG: deoxyuridine 5'-triphosphate nucleotidohydrolase [Chloroflexota bacterium]
MSNILTRSEIEKLVQSQPPLVEDYVNLEEQLQPNGFDLTLREVALFTSAGQIAASNSGRLISDTMPLPFDGQGFINLPPGGYLVTFNEVVHLRDDITALGAPRSSLLRSGVTVETAIWDAGYSGRSRSLLVVHNPAGFRIQRDARIMQLVFLRLDGKTDSYRGKYQGEDIAH